MSNRDNTPGSGNLPVYALAAAVVLVLAALGSLLFVDPESKSTPQLYIVVGLIVTTVPSLIAAAFAERVSRDVRNGTLKGKVVDALDEYHEQDTQR